MESSGKRSLIKIPTNIYLHEYIMKELTSFTPMNAIQNEKLSKIIMVTRKVLFEEWRLLIKGSMTGRKERSSRMLTALEKQSDPDDKPGKECQRHSSLMDDRTSADGSLPVC
ncbi:hypothetical protein CDAR_229501 [Caerostris darwini]|uniref:Uncharacterized protein n=1 Tax=Caerostris darwini TaxID=1538125 RepID=A0AAV4Q3T7_9ARAC|nr:hypothetical protein CDAR_229501 [Caerostris darwini]